MNLTKILETMESAAINAGNMLCNMQPQTRRLASRKDFLTDADLMADKMILRTLKDAYPNIPSFSEESGGKDFRDGYLWVIDPVDGTVNFFWETTTGQSPSPW